VTLHVSSYNWQLILKDQCVINSGTVDDENFERFGKIWFKDSPIKIEMTESDRLDLKFSTDAELQIFPSDEEDDDPEVSLKLPDEQWWDFDFDRGWHKNSDN